jgi:tetratricopeptide (TPR) repeat protein
MKAKLLLLLLWLTSLHQSSLAQIKPIRPFRTIKAIVVGVSDYQSEDIPDLSYAHRDAEAFARFLAEESPWKVASEDLALLTNEQATYGNFISELVEMIDRCQRNDRFILFFSGHGDIETKSKERMGYLLFHDAPPTTYASGGACMVNTLDEYFRQIVREKEAEVILISDACRSGALAGQAYGGPQATTAALASLFSGTAKILSCEPEQMSLESPQLGGGRGIFSYFLVEGLKGEADTDQNRFVDLFELEQYLQDEVLQASGQEQLPIRQGGSKDLKISRVHPGRAAPQVAAPAPPAPDTGYLPELARFEQALAAKHLLYPKEGSAYQSYERMQKRPGSEAIQRLMKVSLSSALQDEAQGAINDYITSPGEELAKRWADEAVYKHFPDYLAKAAELTGKESFFYRDIKSREHYFRGLNLRLRAEALGLKSADSLLQRALLLQRKALELNPIAPHIYNELGLLYQRLKQPKEELYHFQRANALSPTWGLALTNLAASYKRQEQYELAEQLYLEALNKDSSLALTHYNLGVLYADMGKKAKAAQAYQSSIEHDPGYADAYYNLAAIYAEQPNGYSKALPLLQTYQSLEPTDPDGFNMATYLHLLAGKPEEALESAQAALALSPSSPTARSHMIHILGRLGRYGEAIPYLRQSIQADASNAQNYLDLSFCLLEAGQPEEAIQVLEQLLETGYRDYEALKNAPGLMPLLEQPPFQELMQRYFPDEK